MLNWNFFQISGYKRLPCHRLILIARSSVFKTMFLHKTFSESKTGEVVIEDIGFGQTFELKSLFSLLENVQEICGLVKHTCLKRVCSFEWMSKVFLKNILKEKVCFYINFFMGGGFREGFPSCNSSPLGTHRHVRTYQKSWVWIHTIKRSINM